MSFHATSRSKELSQVTTLPVDPELLGHSAREVIPCSIARVFDGATIRVDYYHDKLAFGYTWRYHGEIYKLLAGEYSKRSTLLMCLSQMKDQRVTRGFIGGTPKEEPKMLTNYAYTGMKLKTDCGPVALANVLGPIIGHSPEQCRKIIIEGFGFPGTEGIRDDLWDNPVRHQEVIEVLSPKGLGLTLRVMPKGYDDGTTICLLRHRTYVWCWHWVVSFGKTSENIWLFHNGKALEESVGDPEIHADEWSEVLRYAVTTSDVGEPLAWYWKLWRKITGVLV